MKAAVHSNSKLGKVLEIQDLEQLVPREKEVVVRVHSASVNPLDWRLKSRRPGVDVAGQVVAVGKTVTQFKLGDAVFGAAKGAFAEYASARETKLAPKPEGLSFEQAAAVPIAGITALQGLRNKGRLQAGQKVLINGASGGVGTFAVQMAKAYGAHVAGVCSTKNVALVRSLGADHVIDYSKKDFGDGSERYDLVLDNVGNRTLSALKRALTPNGKIVIVGAPKDFWPAVKGLLKVLVCWPFLQHKVRFFIANINRNDLMTLCQLMQAGRLTPVIDRRHPLNEAGAAIAYAEEGHACGKVMIDVQ